MTSILKYQISFFDNLGLGLKPLYEKDVAEDISMDISTVSRTVRGKYVQTEFGIYELRSFFSHSMKNDDGENISNIEIKKTLKEIIDSEEPKKPLTDEQLVIEMAKHGYKLARRTVAKYREMLRIPKARLRRKLLN
jgi:RNA polymerase sigma-54 factor